MTQIQAVLFDFGKVLSMPQQPEAWERIRRATGLSEQALFDRYWEHRDLYDSGHLTGDEYWHLIAGAPLSAETLAELKSADVDMWTELNEPMMAWVARLHEAGVPTGILSNMPDAMAEGICSKFSWIENFNHAVWSHALKLRKPQQEIYAEAASRLGIPRERILFIDDKEENVRAAEEFGMRAIVYAGHEEFLREMEARGLGYLLKPTA